MVIEIRCCRFQELHGPIRLSETDKQHARIIWLALNVFKSFFFFTIYFPYQICYFANKELVNNCSQNKLGGPCFRPNLHRYFSRIKTPRTKPMTSCYLLDMLTIWPIRQSTFHFLKIKGLNHIKINN